LHDGPKLFCHHLLKKQQGILQPKVDDLQDVGSKDCLQSNFWLISFFDLMVLVASANVKLGEDLLPS